MSIVKECMVVNLQVGIWTGHRLDKDASNKLTKSAKAEDDAARVNKHLVAKDALKRIITAAGAIRMHFYAKTMTWKDNGDRLLTRQIYMQFIEEHSALVKEFTSAREEFLRDLYPVAREQAEFRMGTLFKEEDYPEVRQLRNKFYINLDIDAVTEAGDFRVRMDKDTVAEIRGEMEEAMQKRLTRAIGDLWLRLSDRLSHFAERMKGDGKFKEATITNLEEIVELIPALNFTNDADLENIRTQIKDTIIGHSAKDLRENKKVRKEVAKNASQVMKDMAGFMKAMGVAA